MTYRLALTIGSVVFIEADRYEKAGHLVIFYRNGAELARYAVTAVKELTEVVVLPKEKER